MVSLQGHQPRDHGGSCQVVELQLSYRHRLPGIRRWLAEKSPLPERLAKSTWSETCSSSPGEASAAQRLPWEDRAGAAGSQSSGCSSASWLILTGKPGWRWSGSLRTPLGQPDGFLRTAAAPAPLLSAAPQRGPRLRAGLGPHPTTSPY